MSASLKSNLVACGIAFAAAVVIVASLPFVCIWCAYQKIRWRVRAGKAIHGLNR